jgi:hypothetical protein
MQLNKKNLLITNAFKYKVRIIQAGTVNLSTDKQIFQKDSWKNHGHGKGVPSSQNCNRGNNSVGDQIAVDCAC